MCQGHRARTAFRQLFHPVFCSWLCPSRPTGLRVAVLKSMQGWLSPLAGPDPCCSWAKRVVGQGFLPQCCADLGCMAAGLSAAGRLAGHACPDRAQCGEADGQHCSSGGSRLDCLAQHLTAGPAAVAWESCLSPAQDAAAAPTGCVPSCIAFQVLVLSPGFPSPSLGLWLSGHA